MAPLTQLFPTTQVVDSRPKSKMWYRINATRNMTGGRKIQPTFKMNDKLKEVDFESCVGNTGSCPKFTNDHFPEGLCHTKYVFRRIEV